MIEIISNANICFALADKFTVPASRVEICVTDHLWNYVSYLVTICVNLPTNNVP